VTFEVKGQRPVEKWGQRSKYLYFSASLKSSLTLWLLYHQLLDQRVSAIKCWVSTFIWHMWHAWVSMATMPRLKENNYVVIKFGHFSHLCDNKCHQ
jgi:hypothetical protein